MDAMGIVPANYAVLLWAPVLVLFVALFAWLWLLIAFQKLERQLKPKSLPMASQLESAKTIQNAPMPHGIA